jgi:hypothetical protein
MTTGGSDSGIQKDALAFWQADFAGLIIRPASRAARTVAALHDPSAGTRAFATVVPVLPVFFLILFKVDMPDSLLS